MSAAAGSGTYLISDDFECIDIPFTQLTSRASFVVCVSGDSMEPTYQDGDILLVQAADSIDIGEIGIFVINNEGYVKKSGIGRLISLNQKYPDIVIQEVDEVRARGRVLGKI